MPLLYRLAVSCLTVSTLLPAQAGWSRLYPSQSPPGRFEALFACRESTGDVLLLFGKPDSSGGVLSDSWKFDGTNWTQVTATLPPVRLDSAMVYDAARDRVVLFGGLTGSTRLQDTWLWDGTAWSNPDPAVKPPVRRRHAMAFDRKRGVTVLFAGGGLGSTSLSDLWEWDGTVWVDRTPALSAPGGMGNRLVFDPAHENLLLYAGEYWSWDGAFWHRYQPLIPPLGASFAADLHRRRVVMPFGNGDQFAWEWDGAEWAIRLQASPFFRANAAVAYDPTRRRVVMFGGTLGGSLRDDTWVFRTPSPADVVPFGAGCAGTAGVPQLANAPYSLPWLGDTLTNRVTNLAPAAAGVVFATGFASTLPISLAAYGMPGCDQLVLPAVSEFRLATAGAAEWTLTIPNTPSLANVHLFQQAFALDAAANTAGLVASNGVEITTGIR